jgi:hypothetical protein
MAVKLYKYLPREYLESVLNKGIFLFRSLSYFQDYEDSEIRGDQFEGINKYNGKDGLEINNLTTGNIAKENWTFKSKVDSDNIFIFSTSTKLSSTLAKEFKSDVCIEFTDIGKIINGIRKAIDRRKSIKPNKLVHGEVNYYHDSESPGINWAFPEKITFRKLHSFTRQNEYRFSFSKSNALAYGNTKQEIKLAESNSVEQIAPYPEYILKIGNIKKYCVVHEFT